MSDNDQRLIRECLNGHTAAFGELVGQYQDRLYNTVYRVLNNAEDAQDVVQESFIHAYRSLHTFKGDALFFTWLYRIAVNAAISWKRKKGSAVPVQFVGSQGGYVAEPADVAENHQPGYALQQAEEGQRIRAALSRISAEHRAVLVLKDMEGHKYETMAEILEVPIGTIRSRLHRARLELRQVLEHMTTERA